MLPHVVEILWFAKTFKFRTREKGRIRECGTNGEYKTKYSSANAIYGRFLALGHDFQLTK